MFPHTNEYNAGEGARDPQEGRGDITNGGEEYTRYGAGETKTRHSCNMPGL